MQGPYNRSPYLWYGTLYDTNLCDLLSVYFVSGLMKSIKTHQLVEDGHNLIFMGSIGCGKTATLVNNK